VLASVDGEILPVAEARISVTDEGLLRGDGVFEVIRIYAGRPFALEDHLQRMARSAANARLPVDFEALRAEVDALLAQGAPGDAVLRLVCTRGGRRLAMLESPKAFPETIALATVTYAPTRVLDGIKTLSYGANVLSTRLAQERGADEALLVTPHGRVLEGPTSSFFYVRSGRLLTPPLTDHIHDSITRRRVVEVADVEEEPLAADELGEVEEAFLASTLKEALPVHAIDERRLPAPGPVTREVGAALEARIAEELAPAGEGSAAG
jgi:branched-chain amino acid aminotransferase